jgi:DNA repair exonuclease SbcCD ATPase subunit
MAKKKNLVPEELDDLIQEYLTDGVLTDQERSVILRKAAGMGLDTEEIDLYLEAQVQKIQQAADAVTRQRKGKTCPYCGASVPQLTEKCPYCGEIITPEASEELKEIFDNLETALINLKDAKDYKRNKATVERYARKARVYYGSNSKIQKLLAEVEREMIDAEKTAKKYNVQKVSNLFLPIPGYMEVYSSF